MSQLGFGSGGDKLEQRLAARRHDMCRWPFPPGSSDVILRVDGLSRSGLAGAGEPCRRLADM